MRIAFVVHEYTRTFGHSRYVVELAERFAPEHEVHVFANRVHADAATRGITFHHVPAWRRDALTTIVTFIPCATARVRRGSFDVVHAQGVTTWSADVSTAHICAASWFAAQRREGLAPGWKQEVFERVVAPLERRFYRGASAPWTIAISDAVRRDLASEYGRRERVEVIHHGVDLATFSPARRAEHRLPLRRALGLDDGTFAALLVGDLRRGGRRAIEAVARTADVYLVVVSRSDPAPYRAYAEELGIGARVRFEPPTSSIERYYAAADAFLFPTPYDAFGMVISEAMAAGLSVVTTRRAGAAELITHGVDGFLVDGPEDVAAMAGHLATLAGSRALREQVGAAARARCERQGWDDVARRTLQVYRRALAERTAPSAQVGA
jgi:UDP-glucose:(heptosyl)LPS alpha-1,3-glucosyltransferase